MSTDLPVYKIKNSQRGASIIEILVVVGIVMILTAISVPYLLNHSRLYKSEDQSMKLMNLMREAAQLALVKRHTYRFEIDLTDNAALIIDENGTTVGNLIKKIPLELTRDIRVDRNPAGITRPNPPKYANAVFATDAVGHKVDGTTVSGHKIWAARFKSDGSVVNFLDVPTSATIFVWPPVSSGSTTPRNEGEVRAITMFGGSGAIRYWKYDGTTFVANQ